MSAALISLSSSISSDPEQYCGYCVREQETILHNGSHLFTPDLKTQV